LQYAATAVKSYFMNLKNFIPAAVLMLSFTTAQSQQKEIGNLVAEGIPEVPPTLVERMNQYQNTRSASFIDWHPSGSHMLMSTRFGETAQLHTIDHPGGARKQITFFKEPVGGGSYCRDTAYAGFMFLKDVGGNEFSQLYWFDTKSGNYEMLSDGGRTQNSLPSWSNKGDRFIYTSTRRNQKDYDLYLSSMQNPKEAKLILEVTGAWSPVDWSPDDKKVLVSHYISSTNSSYYILDLESGKTEQVNPSKEEISYSGACWSADGKGVYIIHDQGSEFKTLKYYDVSSKKFFDITQSIPWDVSDLTINKKRTKLAFSINENGFSKLFLLDTQTRKYTPVSGLPEGLIGGFQFKPGDWEIAISINTPQSPGDIYTYRFSDNKLTRWTYSEVGGLNTDIFPNASLVEYETFDMSGGKKRMIPAIIYKPSTVKGKLPVIVIIHGGPEGQSRPAFSSFNTYLTHELGMAVILPNVRGSTGYGKTFLKMDNDYKREESVKDIGALLDWISKQPDLDASRVAVYGGSYGGYMTLASMTHYNDRLKCGIDVVGISNFVTFLKNTEPYRTDLRRVEYGDERIPEMNAFLEKISPSNNVQKITKPMFIIQGANDPRVPKSEAEQMKQKLKDKGNTVWYLLGKDEGHGFRKKTNVDFMQWSIILFLQEYLIK
jgi:dipeptidyl aminopeptidase/acylaminoacyl peptidase